MTTGRDNKADRLRGVLTYRINPEFRVNLIGGIESNNYQSLDMESDTILWRRDRMVAHRAHIVVVVSRENVFLVRQMQSAFRTGRQVRREIQRR